MSRSAARLRQPTIAPWDHVGNWYEAASQSSSCCLPSLDAWISVLFTSCKKKKNDSCGFLHWRLHVEHTVLRLNSWIGLGFCVTVRCYDFGFGICWSHTHRGFEPRNVNCPPNLLVCSVLWNGSDSKPKIEFCLITNDEGSAGLPRERNANLN